MFEGCATVKHIKILYGQLLLYSSKDQSKNEKVSHCYRSLAKCLTDTVSQYNPVLDTRSDSHKKRNREWEISMDDYYFQQT